MKIELNLGDTLLADCTYRDSNDDPVNLDTAGITITAEVSSPDGLITQPVDVIPGDQTAAPGTFQLRGLTSDWTNQVGTWSLGIVYEQESGVQDDPNRFSSQKICVVLL